MHYREYELAVGVMHQGSGRDGRIKAGLHVVKQAGRCIGCRESKTKYVLVDVLVVSWMTLLAKLTTYIPYSPRDKPITLLISLLNVDLLR
jgi:hypothetical protein